MIIDEVRIEGQTKTWMAASATTYAPAVTLTWLVRLRWGSLVAQIVTILVGVLALGAPLSPFAVALTVLTAMSNVALVGVARRGRPVTVSVIGAIIVADTIALTALLFLCGGPSNPFSTLQLVYVTVAALALGIRWASVVVAVSGAGYALLFFADDAGMAAMHMHHDGSAFSAHLQAMWVAFTVTAALIAYFVARVARALREREDELAQARHAAARAEKLASLSTLAAGAAHELGTPLATIAVVAKELERRLEGVRDLEPQRDDARLIRDEVERCRDILQQMSGRSGEAMGEVPETIAVDDLLDTIRRHAATPSASAAREALVVEVDASVPSRIVVPVRGLVQSLRNLLQNAWDAGGSEGVRLHVARDERHVSFEVRDHGSGIATGVLERVGEPFFTTKPPGKGMGLGLFLARTFAERWDGTLTLRSDPARGTRAILALPLTPETRAHVG